MNERVTDDSLDLDPRGNRYSDDVKDVAYQLWAFVASRRVAAVSDLLATGEYTDGDPIEVSSRQIKRWEQKYGWSARVDQDLRAIAPDIRGQTIAEIIFGALDGARYLRAVVDGREAHPLKERVTSAVALLDKAGLSHTGTRPDPMSGITQPAKSLTERSRELAALSDDELERMERDLLTKRKQEQVNGRRNLE